METKRIKVIPKNPNHLFKKWLQELIDDAEKKKKKISKTYQRALDSLNKYPLTLFSGHDCAILENFGPKICQMLDEKLEKHLNERLDLYQQKSYKDKISELHRRENLRLSDLVRSIEAACLIDNSFAPEALADIEEDDDDLMEVNQEDDLNDIQIPEDLLSSSADSDDSFDRLLNKYDPEAAVKRKKLQKQNSLDSQKVFKRQKKIVSQPNVTNDVIDLSQSPSSYAPITTLSSPVSALPAKRVTKFKRYKTFDAQNNLAGPSYASSPISKFLDVETTSVSPRSPAIALDHDDEFDRLAAKYDFVSPIVGVKKPTVTKKVPTARLKTILEAPATILPPVHIPASQSIPVDDEDEIKYTSIDDIDPMDYKIILIVDIGETTG